ncbi:hypothetical protein [Limnoglobus roseus]|uniref:Uncharacterized protein n=1 Tax=Limnoglobus roseus TaxID=2598579 RepID=A0A5C1AN57_9BACT|nr:hypothetical protein [Limnoglobus roseus]QEL20849.1 hypothetical protein PX52LOC_07969 [Limnoglobus roseus]
MALRLALFFGCWCWLASDATAQPDAKKKPDGKPSTVTAAITLQDVSINELIEKTQVKLGYKVGGKVTVKASITVNLDDATAANAYTIRGKVTSNELELESLHVRDLSAEVVYVNGKLTLTALHGTMLSDDPLDKPGTFTGTATAAIDPSGDLTADLKLTNLPLGELLKAVPGGVPVIGAVNGKAEFRAAISTLSDTATWVASADLVSGQLRAYERLIQNPKLKLAVKDGKARLTDVSATVEGIPLTGDGTLTLTGKYPFTATVRTQPQEVSELQKLAPELQVPVAVKGKLETEATATGTLTPFEVSASGSISANDLTVGEVPGKKFVAKWAVTPEHFTVTGLDAELFNGKLSGSAGVPLKADKKGEFALTFTDIDAKTVGAVFPKIPVRVTGQVTGKVAGTIPVAKPNQQRSLTADLNLTSDKLTVQGIPAEKLVGKLSLDGTALKYELEGKTLGGSFEINGRYPEQKDQPAAPAAEDKKGSLRIRNISLSRLAEALQLRGVPLRGRIDLSFDFSDDLTEGSGRYAIRSLGYGRERLIPEFGGRVLLRNGQFELADSTGPVAGGTLRARIRASLQNPARNSFRLDIERADVSRFLTAFTTRPDLVEGGVSLTVRGKIYPDFRATGTLSLSHGRLAGLMASDVRVPFSVTARTSGVQIVVRDATGMIGNGRVAAQFESQWGATGHLTGQVRFTNVKIGNILSDLRQSNYFGNARATGRIDISGENVLSVDDLKATVVTMLDQTSGRDLPLFTQIVPFVSPTALLKPFDTGELRARLSRGVFRIERLTLASPNTDLYADGSVSLNGRLDLAIIIRTGQIGVNTSLIRQIGALATPLPLQVIRAASDLLSNRTVRLTVTGMTSSPQVQLNTAALLTEEAIRYLLRQTVIGSIVTSPQLTPRSNP